MADLQPNLLSRARTRVERLDALRRREGRAPAIRFSIGFKLLALIASLLTVALAAATLGSNHLFLTDYGALVRQFNSNSAETLTSQTRTILESVVRTGEELGDVLMGNAGAASKEDPGSALRAIFDRRREMLAVFVVVPGEIGDKAPWRVMARALSGEVPSAPASMSDPGWLLSEALKDPRSARRARLPIERAFQGEQLASLIALPGMKPAVAIGVPWIRGSDGRYTHALVLVVKRSRFADPFSLTEAVSTWMVDAQGQLVAHSDRSNVEVGEDLSQVPVVRELMHGHSSNQQFRYQDPLSGETKLATYRKVGFAGLGIVAELPEAVAYEGAARAARIAAFISVMVLGIALFTGSLFAGGIVRPVQRLVDASREVARGRFETRVPLAGNDELTYLGWSFNEMTAGLADREHLREVFRKFHSEEIADKILSGAIKLGGERHDVVVLFADLRGFTSMSEAMPPEKVVQMLNEYMGTMIRVITSRGGVIDKFVGDAILAFWGVPRSARSDAAEAVRACLEMREELVKLNERRSSRGEEPLRIGMGLAAGQVVAGNIGSEQRMEFTIIGDPVNLASRLQGLSAEWGVDLLVSEQVRTEAAERFVWGAAERVQVKGKARELKVYRVSGWRDAEGREHLVQTPWSGTHPPRPPKPSEESDGGSQAA